jgi:hypothetical protein
MKLTLATTIMLASLSKEAAAQQGPLSTRNICLVTCPDPANPYLDPGCVGRRVGRATLFACVTDLFLVVDSSCRISSARLMTRHSEIPLRRLNRVCWLPFWPAPAHTHLARAHKLFPSSKRTAASPTSFRKTHVDCATQTKF